MMDVEHHAYAIAERPAAVIARGRP
jgi:hypothetical protein